MKQQRFFSGFILVGFSIYLFFQEANITIFPNFFEWPTLLIIVGISFLGQAFLAQDYEAILPGVILFGFGLHFHVINQLKLWPDHIGVFILIIALGFLLRFQKTRTGFFQGALFLILAILLLFYDQIFQWLGITEVDSAFVWRILPAILLVLGFTFFLIRDKKIG
ncbi:hypothetical protein H1Z61_08695 [Bacillus aquiflavi]|uniref:DUF5668 domain-containing protein n=2 Tax=Bacillus aquiflavi TaxID=2672567 RepID=A0A6B3VZ04_9BACI|nr:hypothetical protein [Bacillus aquiflavi]MBA4537219.1 hypothetical protein [Bacillus aquiflavi]NEY81477.1 hypothetical protein [Bacillus aquiflavi]UAC50069.1 hypothetical protein K6959_12100 [Bacillus aquiflavi]